MKVIYAGLMKGNILEAIIGAIVLGISGFFVYFAFSSSGEKITHGYVLLAKFNNVGGLSVGSDVKINGIKIGIVKSLSIDENYQANAELLIKDKLKIPQDTSAAITTDGIMGNKFVSLNTGFSDDILSPNSEIESTRSALNLEDLIDKFIVKSVSKEK